MSLPGMVFLELNPAMPMWNVEGSVFGGVGGTTVRTEYTFTGTGFCLFLQDKILFSWCIYRGLK